MLRGSLQPSPLMCRAGFGKLFMTQLSNFTKKHLGTYCQIKPWVEWPLGRPHCFCGFHHGCMFPKVTDAAAVSMKQKHCHYVWPPGAFHTSAMSHHCSQACPLLLGLGGSWGFLSELAAQGLRHSEEHPTLLEHYVFGAGWID